MRIPHTVNVNALQVYTASPESLELIGENKRKIVSEDFAWNKDHIPPLKDFCVESINKNFEQHPKLNELPCPDRDYLLEILSVDLPLELVIPFIDDEYYWQRRYNTKFGDITYRKPQFWTWKNLYLERHLQEILEQAQPQYSDEENMDEILDLCAPYVYRVIVSQLQIWKPPLTMEKEDIPEEYPKDHINFVFIFRRLPHVTQFDLVFGMNNVSEDFKWCMFNVSVNDCQRLGKALLELKQLKILRIHKSKIQYQHCQALMQNLIKNRSLVELDLSNCEIGDKGALCVAKLLGVHPTLKKLNLTNNKIGQIGAEGIGYTMLLESCARLEFLSLRLNPLGSEGTMGILRALVRCTIPKNMCLSGCLFDEDIPMKMGLMIKLNESLKVLDISNNWFGEDGGEHLVQALEMNTTLEWVDVRQTDISAEQKMNIKKFLIRNRTGVVETADKDAKTDGDQEDEKVLRETVYKETDPTIASITTA